MGKNQCKITIVTQNSMKISQKGDFENPKGINCTFSTKSVPVFSIVRFPGCTKTVLAGDPL